MTSLFFDIGVYLIVVGMMLDIAPRHRHRPQIEDGERNTEAA